MYRYVCIAVWDSSSSMIVDFMGCWLVWICWSDISNLYAGVLPYRWYTKTHVYIYTYICVHTYTNIYTCVDMFIHTLIYACVSATRDHICRVVHAYVTLSLVIFIYVYIYIHIYIHIQTCICVHIYIYIYMGARRILSRERDNTYLHLKMSCLKWLCECFILNRLFSMAHGPPPKTDKKAYEAYLLGQNVRRRKASKKKKGLAVALAAKGLLLAQHRELQKTKELLEQAMQPQMSRATSPK